MTSAVASALDPCCAVALHANQKTIQALEMLSNAISIDPKNPLARFQKAQVLLSTDQYELALTELKQLVEMAPKEGSVYFVLGKVRVRRQRAPPASALRDPRARLLACGVCRCIRSLASSRKPWCTSRVLSI